MGVLNVTPDSFSDGGRYFSHDAAVAHGLEMVAEGADIVDVGGESSRPGAEPVAEPEELRRVVPVVEALSPHVRVSVDTAKASVAEAAVGAGATLVNDISASLYEVAAAGGVGWVAMHMRGTPRTMQHDPQYNDVARKARIEGMVIIEAIVDKDGNVTDARVLKSLPMGLDQSAVDAVKRWKFTPGTLNGQPVPVIFNLMVNFRLQ